MNNIAAAAETASGIAASLNSWYTDHAQVRGLWATAGSNVLDIRVALEPTSDGDDTLPIWLANRGHWASELQQLTCCEIQLRLVVLDELGEFDVDPDTATIAELKWRASW